MKLLTSSAIVFTGLLISLPSMAEGKIGDFSYTANLDDFTDEDRSTIATADLDEKGLLAWGCKSDGLNVMIHVGSYMSGDRDDDIFVRYRFDQNPASEFSYWRLFPGQNEIAYIRMDKVDEFTDLAMTADEIIMEAVDPLDDESRRFRMGMTGFTEAINKLPCYTEG